MNKVQIGLKSILEDLVLSLPGKYPKEHLFIEIRAKILCSVSLKPAKN